MKLIPIYTENKRAHKYTIYVDIHTNYTYRIDHSNDMNKTGYWISFFAILAIMRSLQEISYTFSSMGKTIVVIAIILVGIILGSLVYKKMIPKEIREIYLTQTMIEDYIQRGRKLIKQDIWIAVISLIIFLFLIFLFLFTSSFVLLTFAQFSFILFIAFMQRLPKERFALYKKSSQLTDQND
ncbi:hypothetical protein [Gracilibacillus suaedae]|uniref:hypothetical protein n=1 Tax=Gracilibacillus suaedae TaxID=2820273 RepID=UPI001ABE6653|nr:hypothetical protein [Gracilibacillus suaedae]